MFKNLSLTKEKVEKLLESTTKLMNDFPVEMARAKIRKELKPNSPIVNDKENIKVLYLTALDSGSFYYMPKKHPDPFYSFINDI